jgi:hypothetical protein
MIAGQGGSRVSIPRPDIGNGWDAWRSCGFSRCGMGSEVVIHTSTYNTYLIQVGVRSIPLVPVINMHAHMTHDIYRLTSSRDTDLRCCASRYTYITLATIDDDKLAMIPARDVRVREPVTCFPKSTPFDSAESQRAAIHPLQTQLSRPQLYKLLVRVEIYSVVLLPPIRAP